MATIKLKFSNAGLLKKIDKERLLAFFREFPEPFAKAGLDISANQEEISYQNFSRFFFNSDNLPDELISTLSLIDAATISGTDDWLLDKCRQKGIGIDEESSSADIALQVWFKDKELLKSAVNRQSITKIRTLLSYFPQPDQLGATLAPFDEKDVPALERELSQRFQWQKYSDYAVVTFLPKDDTNWFLIQHGDKMKREGKVRDRSSELVIYRPELFDIVIFNPQSKELRIKCNNKKDREIYLSVFGHVLAQDYKYFSVSAKYTLEPLQACPEKGPAVLACADVPGIQAVVLREIRMTDGDGELTRKAENVLAGESAKALHFEERQFTFAKFGIRTDGMKERERRVLEIRPPNTMVWTDESTLSFVEEWLQKRGFVCFSAAEDEASE